MFDHADQDPNYVARRAVVDATLALLRARHGSGAVTERPISARLRTPMPAPADWLAGIDAARFIRGKAEGVMCEWTRKARIEGIPWRDLAGPLGVPEDEDDPGRAAWFEVTDPPGAFDTRYFHWECPICGKGIKDYGPISGDPTESEEGHTADCGRHQAEIAAYIERMNAPAPRAWLQPIRTEDNR